MRNSRKKSKLFIIVPTVIIVCITAYIVLNIVFSPYWGSVYPPDGYLSFNSMQMAESADILYSKEEACEDLDYLTSCLERVHPLFSEGIPQNLQNRIDAEKSAWNDEVTSYELWRSAARVLHSLNDSHTMVTPSFPRLYLTDYLQKIDLNYKLTAINKQSINDIFKEKKDLFSFELAAWGKNALTNCFQTKEGLSFIGIDTSYFEFTYISSDGREINVGYTDEDFYDYDTASVVLNKETSDSPSYSYDVNTGDNYGILTINSCDYDNDYKEFLYNFFNEIIEKNVGNVIVDLRDNTGGNSRVADEFILYLNYDKYKNAGGLWRLGPYTMNWDAREENIEHYDDMLFGGNVYILTSSRTFSSGTIFAELISDNGFGKIVGEECGNMPDHYGDVAVFQTPNARLSFQVSTKHFNRIDESKSSYPLVPDYKCNSAEALDKAIDIIKKQ